MATCERCGGTLGPSAPGWCDACGTGARIPARELLDWLLPDGEPLPSDALDADPLAWPDYPAKRSQAREATGTDESVLTAVGSIRGSDVGTVAVVWEFGFLGGSMSSRAGRLIAEAYDTARERRLPVVLLPSTGGARMQEGMVSLVQMAATSVAAVRHANAGLLQVTVVRDPTTGGVFASHANLADVVLAEPHATIGFAGPRVAEAMTGGPLPAGSHTSRGAKASGLVDDVVARPDLPAVLARTLAWPAARPDSRTVALGGVAAESRPTAPGAWAQVEAARAPDRARTPAFLAAMDVALELRGDRAGNDDPTIRTVLAWLAGRPVVVVGMDRTVDEGRTRPAGYRKAWRALGLAERLGIPVVTLVDTSGADASASSEAGGIAHHIARTFAELVALEVPTVALVIGEGGSGGALALAVTDRLLMQEHAIFSVIAPEGAAAILHRDASRAPEVAELLDPTARRLVDLGIADGLVPEPDGREVEVALAAVVGALDELAAVDGDQRLDTRLERWRHAGHGGHDGGS